MQPITKVDLVKRAATNYTHPFVCYDDCDEIVARYRTEAQAERHVREHAYHSWLRLNNTPEHWVIVVTWLDGTGYGYACRHWDMERGECYMTEVESKQEVGECLRILGKSIIRARVIGLQHHCGSSYRNRSYAGATIAGRQR